MLNKKEKVFIGIIAILLVLILGLIYTARSEPILVEKLGEEIRPKEEVDLVEKPSPAYVHISGNVKEPGLVEIGESTRLSDAIELCGGLLEDTDMDRINLAQRLEDEDRIHIARLGEEEGPGPGQPETGKEEKININTCSKEDLLKLPGIGEKKAEQIIDYRQENKFKNTEDIMEVSGIGEKTYESFKDLIIVK